MINRLLILGESAVLAVVIVLAIVNTVHKGVVENNPELAEEAEYTDESSDVGQDQDWYMQGLSGQSIYVESLSAGDTVSEANIRLSQDNLKLSTTPGQTASQDNSAATNTIAANSNTNSTSATAQNNTNNTGTTSNTTNNTTSQNNANAATAQATAEAQAAAQAQAEEAQAAAAQAAADAKAAALAKAQEAAKVEAQRAAAFAGAAAGQ